MSSSLRELYLARLREFYRQPARIFWVYGFPMVLAIGLGVAFRNPAKPSVSASLVVPSGTASAFPAASPIGHLVASKGVRESAPGENRSWLIPGRDGRPDLDLRGVSAELGERQVTTGKTALLVVPDASGRCTYRFDPTRPEALAARAAVDDALQAAGGRTDPVSTRDDRVTEKGSRYIDFLIPGLIGQNTMGAGSGASGSCW